MKETVIGVVGPCASGKTSLVNRLLDNKFNAKHIAQEHSYVPRMWQEITNPDLLIYLDVSFEISMKRKTLNWSPEDFHEQLKRLDDAHNHADLVIDTDNLSPDEVYCIVIEFINRSLELQGSD